jgi:hypothetical protein
MGVQQSKSATAEKAARNEQSVKSKSETAELGARKAQAVQGGREIKTQKVKLASKAEFEYLQVGSQISISQFILYLHTVELSLADTPEIPWNPR